MYIVEIHEMHSIPLTKQDKRIIGNEDQDFCFSGVSEESRFEWLHNKSRLKNFLNSSDEEGQGSINCFFFISF